MRVLLIGSSGFLGRLLARELRGRGVDVEGWSRGGRALCDAPAHRDDERQVDLLRPSTFEAHVGPWRAVVHLAGHTVPSAPWDERLIEENVAMCTNAVAHVARVQPGARFVFLSSAHVYAASAQPLTESSTLAPSSAYGRSKLACEERLLEQRSELETTVVRVFNQLGPRMAKGLFVPDLLEAARVGDGPIVMKGADAERDLLDARDGVRALADLALAPSHVDGAFNLCSGRARALSELGACVLRALDCRRPIVFTGPSTSRVVGSNARLHAAIGWSAQHTLEETAQWIAADERARRSSLGA